MNQKLKHELWVSELVNKISKEQLENYYFTHSKADTCKYFNVPNSSISFLLKYYNIVKPKSNIVKLREQTCLDKYGVKNTAQLETVKAKREQTCIERFGAVSNLCTDEFKQKSKDTCLKKYGTEFANQTEETKQKIKNAKIKNFGSLENCYAQVVQKGQATRIKNSGDLKKSYLDGIEVQSKTILEKYGVPYACMRSEARNFSKSNSKVNLAFAVLLENNNINFSREFTLERFSYDFKVNNKLIEINPAPTHNSTWSIFDDKQGLTSDYHQNKTRIANQNDYTCIHVWDWDDLNKIINLLKSPSNRIYARNCTVKEVSLKDTNNFLNLYHLQGTCRNQTIRLGLYYNDNLISLMTFGKPRYNKNYEYELLRLCTKFDFEVVAGASKLFTYFIRHYSPASIISYCDLSKFKGDVYTKLGFNLQSVSNPSLHWYNIKTKQHITDNLLRQRGFDQLFGTNYGKGVSNEKLMLEHNFVKIYDAGQATYIWK